MHLKQYQMKNPIIFLFIIIGLYFTYCIRDKSPIVKPVKEEPVTCEKDGIISIAINENGFVSEDSVYTNPIDTLFISEVDDSIWIDNAKSFRLPQSQVFTLFFTGELHDLPNYAVIWYKYFEIIDGKRVPFSELDLLGPNQGISLISSIDSEHSEQDSIFGFVFFIDFDATHLGSGQLSIESDDFTETLTLEANKNTVKLKPDIKSINFKVSEYTTRLHISCPDRDSFVELEYDAIWLLQYQDQTDAFYCASTSRSSLGISVEGPERDFRMLGFAPNFTYE